MCSNFVWVLRFFYRKVVRAFLLHLHFSLWKILAHKRATFLLFKVACLLFLHLFLDESSICFACPMKPPQEVSWIRSTYSFSFACPKEKRNKKKKTLLPMWRLNLLIFGPMPWPKLISKASIILYGPCHLHHGRRTDLTTDFTRTIFNSSQ